MTLDSFSHLYNLIATSVHSRLWTGILYLLAIKSIITNLLMNCDFISDFPDDELQQLLSIYTRSWLAYQPADLLRNDFQLAARHV